MYSIYFRERERMNEGGDPGVCVWKRVMRERNEGGEKHHTSCSTFCVQKTHTLLHYGTEWTGFISL